MYLRATQPVFRAIIATLVGAIASGCGGKKGCEGPALNLSRLEAAKRSVQSNGPRASLVIPNPIDATKRNQATATDAATSSASALVSLPALLAPQRLENAFLKVRIKGINDPVSSLAAPNSQGAYSFDVTDVRYSETMAYYSIVAIQSYVEALGFSTIESRPLYVMVRAVDSKDPNGESVNAFYDHGYLDPSAPRQMKLFGNTKFAPGMDRDMYWHEFGHLFNVSVTREIGMDFAGDNGARFTYGAALHECLADHLAQSVGNKSYIGKWIARNLEGYAVGQPLRSAIDSNGSRLTFTGSNINTKDGVAPERYGVAEVCTRMLWEIRQSFVNDDPEMGSMKSDRMIFSAASLLSRDTSLTEFKEALLSADEQLHCGGHESVIQSAFEARGFKEPESLSSKLQLEVSPKAFEFTETAANPVSMAPGASVVFLMRITNPNGAVARNVRVLLESADPGLIPTTYLQGFGDIAARDRIDVATGNGLDLGWAVAGEIDRAAKRGSRLRYRLRLQVENGEETVVQGEISL